MVVKDDVLSAALHVLHSFKERKQVTPRRNRGQGCALHRFPQSMGEKTEKPHENNSSRAAFIFVAACV
jgi:hypothetical protein